MDDDVLIALPAVACTVVGFVVGVAVPGASVEAAFVVAAICGSVGTAAGYIAATVRRSLRGPPKRQATRRPARSSGLTPTPYRKRLASFTRREEAEVMADTDSFRSRMPFWSAADFFVRVPAKSEELIRMYLHAIRDAVRR